MSYADDQHRPGWIVCGGESGPHFRPMELSWMQSIADQCEAAGVPLWAKQDCGRKPGQQGRIPDELWARKQLPTGKDA
jgi:protein gp37